MVWVPSLSASFSFLTSFCRQASERGLPPSCGFAVLLWYKHTSHYFRFLFATVENMSSLYQRETSYSWQGFSVFSVVLTVSVLFSEDGSTSVAVSKGKILIYQYRVVFGKKQTLIVIITWLQDKSKRQTQLFQLCFHAICNHCDIISIQLEKEY